MTQIGQADIHTIREFNRFYTNITGLLDRYPKNTMFSLSESRILYELYHREPCTASQLLSAIQIDKGYLSRTLANFKTKGLLTRTRDKGDARVVNLELTTRGRKEFLRINKASVGQIHNMVNHLSPDKTKKLISHMKKIRAILISNR